MNVSDLREEKKQVLLEALDAAPTVMLHLDARREGVKVPDVHKSNYALALRVGYMLTPPINLTFGEESVTCTLSFNRTPFFCELPWDAIYAIACDDGRAAVWPDDIPPEAAARFSGAFAGRSEGAPGLGAERSGGPQELPKAKRPPARKEKPRLGSVDAGVRTRPVTVRGGAADAKDAKEASPPAEATAADGAAAQPTETDSSPPPAERKPKRELPPYLRVVK